METNEFDAALERGRRRWPGIELEPAALRRRLAAALRGGAAAADAHLRELHVEDLYLACACAAGLPAALEAFEATVMPAVVPVVRRLHPDEASAADVLQALRCRLFLADGAREPGIASYLGKGPLVAWTRAVAARLGLDLVRRARPAEELVDDGVTFLQDDPQLRMIEIRHGADYRHAFAEAMDALTPRERTLLRLQVVNGLNGQQLAAVFHLSASRISESLAGARRKLLDRTEHALASRLRVTQEAAHSIIQALRSRVDLSVERLLTTTGTSRP